MFDVMVMVARDGGAAWNTDTVTGSRRRALERRGELYTRIGRGGLGAVRVVHAWTGAEVYPERWER